MLLQKVAVNLSCVNPSKSLHGVNQDAMQNEALQVAHLSWYGVYMKSSCSDTWPHNKNSQLVRDKCEKADLSANVSNVLSVTPVSTPDITYRNVYCASCNYHNVSEYVFWKPGLYCAKKIDNSLVDYDGYTQKGTDPHNTTLQNTEEYCSIAYFRQPTVTA